MTRPGNIELNEFRQVGRNVIDAIADYWGSDDMSPEVQAQLDRLNQEIVDEIQRSGLAMIMTTRIRGRVAIRMSICSQRTMEEDIEATLDALAHWGRRLYPPR